VRWILILLCGATLSLVGCGGGESFPDTYPVTGVVTLNGQPVEDATVTLVPSDQALRSASGVTDGEGKFAVKTYFGPEHRPDGAMTGDYIVTVSKIEPPQIPEGLSPQEEQAAFAAAGPPKSLLPERLASPGSSDLRINVGTAPPDPMAIDLKM
jgi:hypothetical protein